MKGRVFQRRIVNIQEIKEALFNQVAAIDEDPRRRVYDNIQRRLQECIHVNESHLPNVVF